MQAHTSFLHCHVAACVAAAHSPPDSHPIMKLHASNSIIVLVQAYQLFKARAYGADAVLLIAAVLPNNDLDYLAAAARKLGLQCLIEVRPV